MKHLMKTLLCGALVVFIFWQQAIALSAQQAERITIRGIVLDEKMLPLPFATIEVTPISGEEKGDPIQQVTDDAGQFVLSLPQAEQYVIVASYVGYSMDPMTESYSSLKKKAMLRVKMKEDAQELGEVTVAAKRPLVRIDVDKLAYNVAEDPLSKNQSLRELLRRVPLVTVDGEGNVQVKGSSNFKIYLNGKPSSMLQANPKDILQSIPAGSIKKVEVITDPGVKYDAEGVVAILNIVTEAGASLEGITGTVYGSVLYPLYLASGAYVTAKIGKLGISGNYNYSYMNRKNQQSSEYDTELGNAYLHSASNANRMKMNMHTASLTLTYDLNPHNLLSLSANINPTFLGPNENVNTTERYKGAKESLLYRDSTFMLSKNQSGNVEANLDYQWTGRTPDQLLTVSYRYFYQPSNDDVMSRGIAYVPGMAPFQWQEKNLNDAHMNEHTGQVDYTQSFAKKHFIETGLKYIYRLGKTNPSYQIFDPQLNEWVVGSRYGQHLGISSSPMDYVQTVFAAYASYAYKVEKFSMKAGLRLERGLMDVAYQKVPEAGLKNHFTDVVPQLSLGYNITPTQQLKLNYMMHVGRPSIDQINPYKDQSQGYRVQYGNAALKNERQHTLSLGYSLFKTKFSLNASLNGLYVHHPITAVMFVSPDNPDVIQSTFENYGKKWSLGTNLFLSWNPNQWLRFYSNMNMSYVSFDRMRDSRNINGGQGENKTIRGLGGTAYVGGMATLPKSWIIWFNTGLFRQEPTSYQESFGSGWHSFGVTKQFLKKKLSVSLFANNPFRAHYKLTITQYTGGGKATLRSTSIAPSVGLNISYTFGQLNKAIRTVSRSIENTDLSSEKQGSEAPQGGGAQNTGRGK